MSLNNKEISLLMIFSFIFVFVTNFSDLYCMTVNNSHWVPVNTPPLALGDEYHYFSVLKSMAFGDYFGIPDDILHGVRYLELSRIIPYLLNLPVYYLGSVLFDTRYGVVFVRFFDMFLLFFAMYYFVQAINRSNGWKNNIYLSTISIFILFYGFHGLSTFFVQQDLLAAARNFFVYFGYITNESFIYNNSTINDLSRAIICSSSAPIILFILAYRLRRKVLSLIEFMTLLLVLAFTSLPLAVAFALISFSLDVLYTVDKYKIIRHNIMGVILIGFIVILQTKLIFGMSLSAQELIEVGSNFSFGWGYLTAPLVSLLIVAIGKKYLSWPIIIIIIILSLFQPSAYIIGGEHGSRLWVRSTIIPFLTLVTYIALIFLYTVITKFIQRHLKYPQAISIILAIVLLSVIGRFSWTNTIYLASHQERFIKDSSLLSYMLTIKEPAIVITNSNQISLLVQLYDQKSTPLMSHFSLQSDGYKKNWTKTLVNFELLGIPSEMIIQNISKEAPQRHWLAIRETMKSGTENFENFYFDELLFSSTYATYNHKMLEDKMKNTKQQLQDSFYQMHLERTSVYTLLENKNLLFIIDENMPLLPVLDITERRNLFFISKKESL